MKLNQSTPEKRLHKTHFEENTQTSIDLADSLIIIVYLGLLLGSHRHHSSNFIGYTDVRALSHHHNDPSLPFYNGLRDNS
jgi:hypothetical protein